MERMCGHVIRPVKNGKNVMPRRYTDEEAEATMVPKIVEAIYPVLIPVEQQDCAIQARHYERMTELARMLWREFCRVEPKVP